MGRLGRLVCVLTLTLGFLAAFAATAMAVEYHSEANCTKSSVNRTYATYNWHDYYAPQYTAAWFDSVKVYNKSATAASVRLRAKIEGSSVSCFDMTVQLNANQTKTFTVSNGGGKRDRNSVEIMTQGWGYSNSSVFGASIFESPGWFDLEQAME